MTTNVVDNHIRTEFRSILTILIHFSFSLTEISSILAIVSLQVTLTVTQTCAYRFGIGFWSFPVLIISPLSIWYVLWNRNSAACSMAIFLHFGSTLFATAIIILSLLALLGQIGLGCSTSSLNSSYIAINSSLIGAAALLKLFQYGEILLLYFILRNNDPPSTVSLEGSHERNDPSICETNKSSVWHSWSAISNQAQHDSNLFFA